MLYDKNIKTGRERQCCERPTLHLAVDEGISPKQGGRTGLAKTNRMIISLCSHGLNRSFMFKPTSYFTAVVCVVEAFLNISKTRRTHQPQQ